MISCVMALFVTNFGTPISEGKYYAPGISVIRERAVKGDPEVVELLWMTSN